MSDYNPKEIEAKWQKKWLEEKVFAAHDDSSKPKYYQLETFPYPSGAGLHVGHPKGYIAEDIHARFTRMHGKEVLYTMGWDAFGLPTENYALKIGKTPREVTRENTDNFRRQVRMFGLSYDWDREINTSQPDYYKWTQWLFIQLFKRGLAHRAASKVNWCPKDQTVLANEQVVGGKCERCGSEIEERDMEQWFVRITKYADRLLSGLQGLDWPAATVKRQEDWIGRSEGAEISFLLDFKKNPADNDRRGPNGERAALKVFTTRPDTLFGATYLVLAPEHPWVTLAIDDRHDVLTNKEEVKAYVAAASHKTERMRQEEAKEKTGVELKGVRAINPATGKEIPIWVADYVLGGYGTGAIMAVPAHDERDFEFAKKFGLEVKQVVLKKNAPIKSYLMGAASITNDELKKLGVEVVETTSGGDRKIVIPRTALAEYEKLITQKLDPGFWNEYIGDEIVFIFKHKDNTVERIALTHETASKINELASQFANQKFISPWLMLAENGWYTDVVIHGGYGVLTNSAKFDGMDSEPAKWKITEAVGGERKTQYKLRDWSVSRQRYWGVPIPMVHCEACRASGAAPDGIVLVPDADLPVLLPDLKEFRPQGMPPLAASPEFMNVKCPQCGGDAKRDPETLDTFVDSSWYYLRYTDPRNATAIFDKAKAAHWLPVDLYVIGAEHTVLHLLYARFITKFLHDEGWLAFDEPFLKLRHQGLIRGEDGAKMSKSKGNVVNPDEIVGEFSADTVRMYEMFMGPFEDGAPWDPKGILGVERFLKRVWKYVEAPAGDAKGDDSEKIKISLHKAIKKVGEDIVNFKFNTAISALMILLNELEKSAVLPQEDVKIFLKLLHPFAPHLAQELWSRTAGANGAPNGGATTYLDFEPWPTYDPALVRAEKITLVLQVNSRTRDSIEVDVDITEGAAKQLALENDKMKKTLNGATPKKIIYVDKKLVNIVV